MGSSGRGEGTSGLRQERKKEAVDKNCWGGGCILEMYDAQRWLKAAREPTQKEKPLANSV